MSHVMQCSWCHSWITVAEYERHLPECLYPRSLSFTTLSYESQQDVTQPGTEASSTLFHVSDDFDTQSLSGSLDVQLSVGSGASDDRTLKKLNGKKRPRSLR
ncbi:hypothetical protein BCR42DRAFT_466380 [Absidia repens]|uniref:Uncharacterized protein n=1 Tax=Absidia repens TaxID=90262 RepID=A0A1X2IF40_9FUNG|nr:hypothetical protein BCR42DRAFT_466380 [Absidia repens]